ncbi:MAG: tetratricopeptide repeat protein [Plesiomonas sp.]|uniref:tetratricopeptide repeat protein n=1 Tax=Plesiomonas sp. TaxID=2486279 RepID=UPI003F2A1371
MNKIKLLIKKSWRESKGLNKITNIPLAVIFSYLLDTGKSSSLVRLDSITSKITYPTIAYYYFAHAHYLYGNYDTARKNLNKVLKKHPYHADSTYLLCSIDEIEEKKEAAWKKIISLAHNNQRLKTWLIMANMVNNENEFAILKREWEHAISLKKLDEFHLDVNGYIATGALRAKLYSHAIKIWEELLEHIKKTIQYIEIHPCRATSLVMMLKDHCLTLNVY